MSDNAALSDVPNGATLRNVERPEYLKPPESACSGAGGHIKSDRLPPQEAESPACCSRGCSPRRQTLPHLKRFYICWFILCPAPVDGSVYGLLSGLLCSGGCKSAWCLRTCGLIFCGCCSDRPCFSAWWWRRCAGTCGDERSF